MYNSEFEKQVQAKMEELKMTPSDNMWDRIEKDLPQKPRRRNVAILLLLLLAGISGLMWMVTHFYNRQVTGAGSQTITKRADTEGSKEKLTTNSSANTDGDTFNQSNNKRKDTGIVKPLKDTVSKAVVTTGTAQQAGKITTALPQNASRQKKTLPALVKQYLTVADKPAGDNKKAADNDRENKSDVPLAKQSFKNKSRTKIGITQQDASTVDNEQVTAADALTAMPYTATAVYPGPADMNKNLWPVKKISTKEAALQSLTKSDKEKEKRNWELGITLAGGLSKQGRNPLYFKTGGGQVALLGISGLVADSANDGAARAQASKAFDIGFYLRRQVKKRWGIQAGLSYSYLSYRRTVGARVDSLASYNFNGVNINSTGYYPLRQQFNVTSLDRNAGYLNQVHLLQLPFEAQYSLGKQKNWYLIGGISAGYLLGSNALVYKSNFGAYISSKEVYNKLLLSLHTGIGFTNNRGRPFSAGVRFSYSATSFVKKSINKQHLLSGLLFVNIPFKKNK
jgi:hypothetical protein